MKTVGAYLLMGTALLACPCHLVFLLPAVLGLLGGTALGAALEANTALLVVGTTVYFFAALAGGMHLINRRARSEKGRSPAPSSAAQKTGAPTSVARLAPDARRAETGASKR
ncbi:MAG: hypothetical protein M3P70_09590 [Actinomycetota bacterium]|nr:hypothetical protein [Actinomycetota bacterium]